MTQYQNSAFLNQLTLGKSTEYANAYDATLLQGIPRTLNRDQLFDASTKLPFIGEDVWYGYELSWLNHKGKPVVAVAEFRIPCESPNIIESKSFKLYLNSFNQTKFTNIDQVLALLIKDLSHIAASDIKVSLYPVDQCSALNIANLDAYCIDEQDIEVSAYDLMPNTLISLQADRRLNEAPVIVEETLVSHLLKSNCLITNQPDWASIYIHYKGPQLCHETLLRYLISFRNHNEFHEQCVERIFCDLQQHSQLSSLSIQARYTRRGGLDINPYRSTDNPIAPSNRTLRQ